MSFEDFKSRPRETISKKYLLLCLLAFTSLDRDNGTKETEISFSELETILEKPSNPPAIDTAQGYTVSQNEKKVETWDPQTTKVESMAEPTRFTSDSVYYPPTWENFSSIGVLKNSPNMIAGPVTKNDLEVKRIETPLNELTQALRNFANDYKDRTGYLNQKRALEFIKAIDNIEKDFGQKLETFAKNYKTNYEHLNAKMQAYLDSEIKKGHMTMPSDQVEDFIFLTCFLDYLETDGTFNQNLKVLKVEKTLRQHLNGYANQGLDSEMARFGYFSSFFYKTWQKMATNPGHPKIATKEEIEQKEFKELLKECVPLSLVLEISRKYRQ